MSGQMTNPKRKNRVARKTIELFKRVVKAVAPVEPLTVSEWADKHRIISPESAAEPGRWRTDRAPFQRDIMDALSDPYVETVVIKSSSQVGKTEILLNIVGYFIEHDPAPIIFMQPTVKNAEEFSKGRIAPMIRDTPVLTGRVKSPRSRDAGNTILNKSYPGGNIVFVGSNAASDLASKPRRILLCDEVDRYPASAGTEGDPISLAEKRTKTYWNRKKVYVSTPGNEKTSRIQKDYLDGTQEVWCLPCPSCERHQSLDWESIDHDTAMMKCNVCGEYFTENDWKSGLGVWISQNPTARNKRSFHLNALASPWERWETIIDEYYKHKKEGKESMKTWVNTFLGEVWPEDEGENSADHEQLYKRCEEYGCDIPEGVIILTAGVDVQDDRLEIEVVGWGLNDESWGIEYKVFYGAPKKGAAVWDALDQYLLTRFKYEDGSYLNIACTCIDTGGHYTSEVYTFTKARESRWVYSIKGVGGSGKPFTNKPTRNNDKKALLFALGVDAGKERIYSDLAVMDQSEKGFCHFPSEPEKGYSKDYFKSLCSEKKVTKYSRGVASFEWKKIFKRNEGLDLRNYARAAFVILNPKLDEIKRLRGNDAGQTVVGVRKKRRSGPKLLSKGI